MHIVFVEDDATTVADAIEELRQRRPDVTYRTVDFSEFEQSREDSDADVVVLDLMADIAQEPAGLTVSRRLWNGRFRPVVVYSGYADLTDDQEWKHPLRKVVMKGTGSDKRVVDAIEELLPHGSMLRRVEGDIREQITKAMKVVAPYFVAHVHKPTEQAEMLLGCLRRRLAAYMDVAEEDVNPISRREPWEWYLWPPLNPNPQLGDVLMDRQGAAAAPSSFRVVLTPSCDMAKRGCKAPKVQSVLVATCVPVDTAVTRAIGSMPKADKLKDKISRLMSTGHQDGIVLLYALGDQIPHMAADLRQLALIPISEIGIDGDGGTATYIRVASLDSPFRELVSWAYLSYACRPGLPDCDRLPWLQSLNTPAAQTDGEAAR